MTVPLFPPVGLVDDRPKWSLMLGAALFDFDGLILDTESPEIEITRAMFGERGFEYPDSAWQFQYGRGREQLKETPMEMLRRLSGDGDLDDLNRERRRRITERVATEEPRPGIVSLLDDLAASGIPYGIASNSFHDWIEGHLERIGLRSRFRTIVGADDVARTKPFPDLYLTLMERLGVRPDDCIAFEDSPNGVTAARAAGVFTVAVENAVSIHLDLTHANVVMPSLAGTSVTLLSGLMEQAHSGYA